jgi:glycosyltransferase involved in cell wall biosynthesis
MSLSVCIVSCNEEENIGRTLSSVFELAEEIILVDSGSTDRTLEIARGYGPKIKIFVEPWKGFGPQKNSALGKASCDWILLLDADESLTPELSDEIARVTAPATTPQPDAGLVAYRFPRRNIIFGRWIKHGGYYPDPKVGLIRRGTAGFENRLAQEDLKVAAGSIVSLQGDLIHHAHHTLFDYIEHGNRHSSLDAEMVAAKGPCEFSVLRAFIGPAVGFIYDYVLRGGVLDGREGLLLHLNHAACVSWKYTKAWELSREKARRKEADEEF